MIVVATSTFTLGDFTVQQRPRFDNPAFAVYLIFLRERLIGKQFSMPSESDCRWLERNHGVYATAEESQSCTQAPQSRRYIFKITRRGRPTNEERARRLATLPGDSEEY